MTDRCQCDGCKGLSYITHASSCAVHNAPALPVGPCDCDALRADNERLRAVLTIIAGSADKLQALQATAALDNIGAKIS